MQGDSDDRTDDHEAMPPADDETEGYSFNWDLVEDPKGGKHLRQGWDPNDPALGKPQPRKSAASDSEGR
jgi:hypothetical protein